MKKHYVLFLGIGLLLCTTIAGAQFPRIQLSLNVHDNSQIKFYRQLCWGLDPNATMGRDASLANVVCGSDTGEKEHPPWPPEVPEVRWVDPPGHVGVLGEGTYLDLRQFYSHTQIDTYRVRLQDTLGGLPITLSWPRVLVHDYYGCSARLVMGFDSPEVDMRAQDSVTITNPDIQYVLLIMSCPLGSNSISGTVFQDMEGDGHKGTGDPPLSGWKVRLNGTKIDSVNSDASGNYTFTNLPNGSYTVSEAVQTGWLQTAPATANYSISLADGQTETGDDFGNFQYATLGGIKFDDMNGNGKRDEGDTLIAGWKIILQGVTPETTTTNGVDHFSFTHVGPGEYTIRERQDSDWVQIKPGSPGFYSVIAKSGAIVDTFQFGNKRANRFQGTSGGSWSDPGNWSFGHAPDATEAVVIPTSIVIDILPNTSVLALRVAPGGSITYSSSDRLTVLRSIQIDNGSTLQFPSSPMKAHGTGGILGTRPGLICEGDWIVKGTFIPGTSLISFVGDTKKWIEESPFYDLEIQGKNTATRGTIVVSDTLYLRTAFDVRPQDTVVITSPVPGAIQDTGTIVRGTVTRSINLTETGAYRFNSPDTYLKFDGIGNPSAASVTVIPDSLPPSRFKWKDVGGTADPIHHTVKADGIRRFSKWVIGPHASVAQPLDTPAVARIYTVHTEGLGTAAATLQLSYDPAEVQSGVSESSLHLLHGPIIAESVYTQWNMVSVPVTPEFSQKDSLFPAASSAAVAYDPSVGYGSQPLLSPGQGYWMRFPASDLAAILGDDITLSTINVLDGWNMIGSISTSINKSSITSIPSGIIASSFFGYKGGYHVAQTIDPMRGYWVKASGRGQLVLNAAAAVPKGATAASLFDGLNRITVRDASGNEATAYFGLINDVNPSFYSMPPLPPEGVFDVRFATGRMAEFTDGHTLKAVPLRVSSAVGPLTILWECANKAVPAVLQAGTRTVALKGSGKISLSDAGVRMSLVFHPSTDAELPGQFALEQNYPNPFNPSTIIGYELPVPSKVVLKIYDVLGRNTATLVDEIQDGGFKSVEWNARTLASGIYFYRLEATSLSDPSKAFAQVRKMILLK